MPRRLPSLNGLKAFEAAARHESFTRAAEELNVTQGAVSHQVKALEAELGLKLFNRERQRLVITEAGRGYHEVVRDALDRIAAGTERLLQRERAGVLTITTSPNFATKWLVHRLGRFAEAHPKIELRVSASLQHVDFVREDVDLAVRHSEQPSSAHAPSSNKRFDLLGGGRPDCISDQHADLAAVSGSGARQPLVERAHGGREGPRSRRQEPLRARDAIQVLRRGASRTQEPDRVVQRRYEPGPRRAAARSRGSEKHVAPWPARKARRPISAWSRAEEVELRRGRWRRAIVRQRHAEDKAALARLHECDIGEKRRDQTRAERRSRLRA